MRSYVSPMIAIRVLNRIIYVIRVAKRKYTQMRFLTL
jgi:hypothetical protein